MEAARAAAPAAVTVAFRRALLDAHFAGGRDIGAPAVILALAEAAGIDAGGVEEAWRDGSAFQRLETSQSCGRVAGVQGTPAWKIGERLVEGLQPAATLLALAKEAP